MQNSSNSTITFVGGARNVTGSNFLIEVPHGEKTTRVLVDCGLEQGARFCESSNNAPFPYDARAIDAVFVTHAHADHIGLLPKLTKAGYRGPVYATAPTTELIPVMLDDSVSLIAREAAQCKEEPPYTRDDVDALIPLLKTVALHETIAIALGVTATFYNAGHILGSALVVFDIHATRVLFTGDLGRTPALLTPDPEFPEQIDYLVTESVYGNRAHVETETSERDLENAIRYVTKKRGTLVIPAFSIERTQIILATIDAFLERGSIEPIPVFLDSPLATRVTDIYRKYPEFLRTTLETRLKSGDDPFSFPQLRVTYTRQESAIIDETSAPKIIIAGAGMSHGGRVRHHEKRYLADDRSIVMLVGYQVPGSLGRRLQDGAREVTIDRKTIKVRAKIMKTGGFSAHADRDDLLAFAEKINPKKAFVVLGEMEASSFLAQRITGFLGIPAYIPSPGERITL
jgi:metallo-beta-lactamase family protein